MADPREEKASVRRYVGTGLALLMLVVGAASGNDTAVASSDASLRAVVWQAALLVLSERGLAVQSASPEEGRILTAFTPLAPEALAKTTVLTDQDRRVQWTHAQYRYSIRLGGKADRERFVVSAEIWAWEQGGQTTPSRPEVRRALPSNKVLEREFLDAFVKALGRVAGE